MFTPKTIIEEEVLPLLEELGSREAKARVLELDELIRIDQDDHYICRVHRLTQLCVAGLAIQAAKDTVVEMVSRDKDGGIELMSRVVGLNARLAAMSKQLMEE